MKLIVSIDVETNPCSHCGQGVKIYNFYLDEENKKCNLISNFSCSTYDDDNTLYQGLFKNFLISFIDDDDTYNISKEKKLKLLYEIEEQIGHKKILEFAISCLSGDHGSDNYNSD